METTEARPRQALQSDSPFPAPSRRIPATRSNRPRRVGFWGGGGGCRPQKRWLRWGPKTVSRYLRATQVPVDVQAAARGDPWVAAQAECDARHVATRRRLHRPRSRRNSKSRGWKSQDQDGIGERQAALNL